MQIRSKDVQPRSASRAVIVLAHGSRDPLWCQPVEEVARRIKTRNRALCVRCAYLEITAPNLIDCVAGILGPGSVLSSIAVLPLFLGIGKHGRDDLPKLMATLRTSHPQVAFSLKPTVGEMDQVLNLIARLAIS